MRPFVLVLAITRILCSDSPPACSADIDPIQVIDTGNDASANLGVSSDGKTVFCFDQWTLTQINLVGGGNGKKIPLPRRFDRQRIYSGVRLEKDIWLLAIGRIKFTNDWEGPNNRYVVFDFATNTVKADWASHADIGATLMIAPKQNYLIAAGCSTLNDIWFWDLKKEKKVAELNLLLEFRLKQKEISGVMQRMVVDPTSSFIAFGLVDKGIVQVWDIDKKRWHSVIPQRKSLLLGPLVFLDSRTLAACWIEKSGGREFVEVYDWQTRNVLSRAEAKGILTKVAASADGRMMALMSYYSDRRESWIRLWDVKNKREVAAFKAYGEGVMPNRVRFTDDGKRLISSGGTGVLKVWDVERIVKSPKP